ncbi:homoserine dehydrogenase [Montanilutibacter psychrotolerans]|uniref:Homoserine dehydrogenase n=1 Tax=Montanilutibacter psychrotolerans TaxID=1327343 RepID=A0A3M8SXB1_9GAMM|nr:homoserine dehydrogenase [Lysobacter psychrotolerans]RNF86008.1 homoserine dehydrogenase [Lysobacter psychrotolerans]
MNAVAVESGRRPRAAVEPTPAPARIALLGTGTVGSAVLERLSAWEGTPYGARLSLMHVANSRVAASGAGLCPRVARSLLAGANGPANAGSAAAAALPSEAGAGLHVSDLDGVATALRGEGPRIVIDATASGAVAERHAPWLAQGIHVVTACKLGQGTSLAGWRAIRDAAARGGTRYGDSATVGAGLPLLRSIRELREGGDRIHAIAGVLSGSLAWLFNHYDGLRPFSGFVREARDAGYTEPDPRDDLSGEDVRRKLLILARAAGFELESADVEVASLVPPSLAALSTSELDAALPQLDTVLRDRYAAAWKHGEKLRFIARLERAADGAMRARVGLESLAADHPLAGGAGTDNRLAIWSDRYQAQPLLLQGPGAGAAVTAAGLLDDVLRIARAA